MDSLIIIIEEVLRRELAKVKPSQKNYEATILEVCQMMEDMGMPYDMVTVTIKGILKSWHVEFL